MVDKDDKEAKVFDVAKPGKSKPDIGSKPMIVGHKSLANDPMVKEDSGREKPAGERPEVSKEDVQLTEKSTSKVKIEPLSEEMKPKDKEEAKEEVNEASGTETEEKDSTEQQKEVPEDKTENDKDNKKPEEREGKKDKKTDKKDEKMDPAAEAMEQEHKLNQIIESKKYNVNISEKKSGSLKTFLYVFFGLFVAGLIALFVLIDTNTISTNIELPFRIFGSENTETVAPVDTSQALESPVTAKTNATSDGLEIPEGFNEYKNTFNGISIWFPSPKLSVATVGLEDDSVPKSQYPGFIIGLTEKTVGCCSISVENLLLKTSDATELKTLFDVKGVKGVAGESRRVNVEDNNEYINNKTVSELAKTMRGSVETYEFTVTGSTSTGFFADTKSGAVIDKPTLMIFFETDKGVSRIIVEDDREALEIVNTLSLVQ